MIKIFNKVYCPYCGQFLLALYQFCFVVYSDFFPFPDNCPQILIMQGGQKGVSQILSYIIFFNYMRYLLTVAMLSHAKRLITRKSKLNHYQVSQLLDGMTFYDETESFDGAIFQALMKKNRSSLRSQLELALRWDR